MTEEQLLCCRQADILNCDSDCLANLKEVCISSGLPVLLRTGQFLEQVKNPYLFKVDTLIVKVSFSGNRDLTSKLTDLMTH